jgi:hypothetical protein
MTIAQQIQKWFDEEGSYMNGVALMGLAGYDNRRFQIYLSAAFVPYDIQQRLNSLLSSYLIEHPAEEALEKTEVRASPSTYSIPQKNEPDAILALREKAKKWHKKQAMLHAEMRSAALAEDEKKTYEYAREIMEDVIPTLDEIYDNIRKFQETGELPSLAATNDIVAQTVQKMERLYSFRSRVSRLKGKIKKGGEDDNTIQKWKKELLEKELEIKRLENELGK